MALGRASSIAVCITAFEYGGQGRVVEQELTLLRERYDVSLCVGRCTRPVPDGVTLIEFGPAGIGVGSVRAVAPTLSTFDLLHCHDSLAFMRAANQSGRPWVVTSHGICPPRYRAGVAAVGSGLLTRSWYPSLYRSATEVVAISEYIGRWLRQLGVHPEVIPNGAEPIAQTPAPPVGRNMVYVGELSRRKGVHDMVRSLTSTPPDVTLTLVGRGAEQEARREADAAGVRDRVRVVTDADDRTLEELYAAAFVTFSGSFWEGFGLPTLEGFGFGRPAIVRDVGGMAELVSGSGAGVVWRHPEEVGAAVDTVTKSWDEMSRAALAYAASRTWAAAIDRYSQLFEQILGAA